MLVQKYAHNYINLKNGYQQIQLDNTTFRTTGMYNFVCMEMCSKTDSIENNYNKITVVNVYSNYMLDFSKYIIGKSSSAARMTMASPKSAYTYRKSCWGLMEGVHF